MKKPVNSWFWLGIMWCVLWVACAQEVVNDLSFTWKILVFTATPFIIGLFAGEAKAKIAHFEERGWFKE